MALIRESSKGPVWYVGFYLPDGRGASQAEAEAAAEEFGWHGLGNGMDPATGCYEAILSYEDETRLIAERGLRRSTMDGQVTVIVEVGEEA